MKLTQTVLLLAQQQVQMTVTVDIGGAVPSSTTVQVTANESELLVLAGSAGRTDWNTDDCRAYASAALGQAVI